MHSSYSGTGNPACALLPYSKVTSNKIVEDQSASGTGNLACAGLPSCKTTSRKILQEQIAIGYGLWQHSQEWLCHKDQRWRASGTGNLACAGLANRGPEFLRWLYRDRRLSSDEFTGRLRALGALAAAKRGDANPLA